MDSGTNTALLISALFFLSKCYSCGGEVPGRIRHGWQVPGAEHGPGGSSPSELQLHEDSAYVAEGRI